MNVPGGFAPVIFSVLTGAVYARKSNFKLLTFSLCVHRVFAVYIVTVCYIEANFPLFYACMYLCVIL